MFWWMPFDPAIDDPAKYERYVPDLTRDPFHRAAAVPGAGAAGAGRAAVRGRRALFGGVGLSWLVWGVSVRTTLLYHATWLVNGASHLWGYQTYRTRDGSTNLWWVALLSLGEGWHTTTTRSRGRPGTG